MRLMREGKNLKDIRAYIDAEYSKYGPPTDTGPVQEGSAASCGAETVDTCGGAASDDASSELPGLAGPEPNNN